MTTRINLCAECLHVAALGQPAEVLTVYQAGPVKCAACGLEIRGHGINAVWSTFVERAATKLGLLRLECERAILKAEAR